MFDCYMEKVVVLTDSSCPPSSFNSVMVSNYEAYSDPPLPSRGLSKGGYEPSYPVNCILNIQEWSAAGRVHGAILPIMSACNRLLLLGWGAEWAHLDSSAVVDQCSAHYHSISQSAAGSVKGDRYL